MRFAFGRRRHVDLLLQALYLHSSVRLNVQNPSDTFPRNLGYEERRCRAIVRAISFQDFQPMWFWSINVTDGRTDGRTTCNRNTTICTLVHRAVKIMTDVLTRSSYVETFQFSASGQRTVRVSVMSSWFPAADCSTLVDQRLKSFVDRTKSPWLPRRRYNGTS